MGLFDYMTCDMPLPEGAEGVREWQTKDLDCSMSRYAIRRDGCLVDTHIRMEPKPGAPELPPLMVDNYLEVYHEWWERKEGPDIPVNFTGSVRFHGRDAIGKQWEFCAFIESGKCFRIIQMEPDQRLLERSTVSYSLEVIAAAARVARTFENGCDRCNRADLDELEAAGLMSAGVCEDTFGQDSLEKGEPMWTFNADGEALVAAIRSHI